MKKDVKKSTGSRHKSNPKSTLKSQIDINPQFAHAFHLMGKTHQNLFITGKAGTGKSTLLHYFCTQADKSVVVLAPTGVVALNVKGETIHRFFNFYIDVTPQKIKNGKNKPKKPQLRWTPSQDH